MIGVTNCNAHMFFLFGVISNMSSMLTKF